MQTVSYTVILGMSSISVLYLQKIKEQKALCGVWYEDVQIEKGYVLSNVLTDI